jgi:hypothetical protein
MCYHEEAPRSLSLFRCSLALGTSSAPTDNSSWQVFALCARRAGERRIMNTIFHSTCSLKLKSYLAAFFARLLN